MSLNETLKTIKARTSANLFDASHVLNEAEIKELVTYAIETPSSFNMQNWRVIAFSSLKAKEALKAAAFGQPKVKDAAVTFVFIGQTQGHLELPRLIKPLLDAKAIDEATFEGWLNLANGMYEGKEQLQRDEAIRSASMAAMTMMYAAQSMGYVSGAMIGFDPDAVSQLCHLKPNEFPVMLLSVGKPAPGNWPRKPRKAVDEMVTFQ